MIAQIFDKFRKLVGQFVKKISIYCFIMKIGCFLHKKCFISSENLKSNYLKGQKFALRNQ